MSLLTSCTNRDNIVPALQIVSMGISGYCLFKDFRSSQLTEKTVACAASFLASAAFLYDTFSDDSSSAVENQLKSTQYTAEKLKENIDENLLETTQIKKTVEGHTSQLEQTTLASQQNTASIQTNNNGLDSIVREGESQLKRMQNLASTRLTQSADDQNRFGESNQLVQELTGLLT